MHLSTSIRLTAAVALLATGSFLAGCSSHVVAATGFIPEAVKMKGSGETRQWNDNKVTAASFGKVIVKPVEMPAGNAYGDLTPEQLTNVREMLFKALAASFDTGMGTGTRTLVIHAAVTSIKPNQPLRNIAPQSQILRGGYGYAACEIYATDGETGPVVAAYMNTTDTKRFGTGKLSAAGTAEAATADWAKSFRELIAK